MGQFEVILRSTVEKQPSSEGAFAFEKASEPRAGRRRTEDPAQVSPCSRVLCKAQASCVEAFGA